MPPYKQGSVGFQQAKIHFHSFMLTVLYQLEDVVHTIDLASRCGVCQF